MYNYSISKQIFVYFITVSICFLPHSSLMTGFVRRWMQLVEHELLTLLKHMSLSPIFVVFMLHDHIVMSNVLYITVCPFVLSPFLCTRHILCDWVWRVGGR